MSTFDLFRDAYEHWPDPSFLYNMAVTARLAGKFPEAIFFYRQYLYLNKEVPPDQVRIVENAVRELEEMRDAGPP